MNYKVTMLCDTNCTALVGVCKTDQSKDFSEAQDGTLTTSWEGTISGPLVQVFL